MSKRLDPWGLLCPLLLTLFARGGDSLDKKGAPAQFPPLSNPPRCIPLPDLRVSRVIFHVGGSFLIDDRSDHPWTGTKAWVVLTDVRTGKECHRIPIEGWVEAFAQDGKRVVLASRDGSLSVRTIPENKELCRLKAPQSTRSRSYRFSPDGRYLAVIFSLPQESNHLLRVWDVERGKEVAQIGSLALGSVEAISFSGDSKYVAAVHANWVSTKGSSHAWIITNRLTVRLWEVASGKQRGQIGVAVERTVEGYVWDRRYGEHLLDAGASPDGWKAREAPDGTLLLHAPCVGDRFLLFDLPLVCHAGGGFRFLRAWSASPRPVWERMDGHPGTASFPMWHPLHQFLNLEDRQVQQWAVSPDGRWLASCGTLPGKERGDQLILWDLSRLRPSTPVPDSEAFQAMWHDLGSERQGLARRAAAAFASCPERSLPWLRERVRPLPTPWPQWVSRRIGDLEHHKFAIRQKAECDLEGAGIDAVPALRDALKDCPSLEMRRRIEHVLGLNDPMNGFPPAARRTLWVVELLEQLDTSSSREFLKELVGGDPAGWITREAKSSLLRLKATKQTDK